ncbi:MAG: hypothetical protein EBZ50_11140, partial [Alphaproteobacteria bacterium]|nr:hypothetical protein [Alphaproteobacteria bacterium]
MKYAQAPALALGLALSVMLANPAHAQLSKLPFGGQGAPAAQSQGDPVANHSDFLGTFLAARVEMNTAQLALAKAFDLKDKVAALEAEQVALKSGALDSDGYKKSKELSEGVTAALTERMDAGVELTVEGQKNFIAALPPLVKGTLMTARLPAAAKAWAEAAQSAASSASMQEKMKLGLTARTAVAVAKDMPGFTKLSIDNYKKVVGFGTAKKIAMPKDA